MGHVRSAVYFDIQGSQQIGRGSWQAGDMLCYCISSIKLSLIHIYCVQATTSVTTTVTTTVTTGSSPVAVTSGRSSSFLSENFLALRSGIPAQVPACLPLCVLNVLSDLL